MKNMIKKYLLIFFILVNCDESHFTGDGMINIDAHCNISRMQENVLINIKYSNKGWDGGVRRVTVRTFQNKKTMWYITTKNRLAKPTVLEYGKTPEGFKVIFTPKTLIKGEKYLVGLHFSSMVHGVGCSFVY